MQLTQGWKQVELIEKSPFNKEPIQGKATMGTDTIYYSGVPVVADGKYFIKEEQIIAYE